MDRLSVSRMCAAWGWQARPLHAIRGVNGQQGSIWLVQSNVVPNDNVFPMRHGNVLVSKLPSKDQQSDDLQSRVVGTSATVEFVPTSRKQEWSSRYFCSSGTLGSNYVNKVSGSSLQTLVQDWGSSKLKKGLKKLCLAKLPSNVVPDDGRLQQLHDAADSRFVALEQQVSQLTQQHENMEKQLEASSKHHDAQLGQFKVQVKAQLDAQGHQMENLFQTADGEDRRIAVQTQS